MWGVLLFWFVLIFQKHHNFDIWPVCLSLGHCAHLRCLIPVLLSPPHLLQVPASGECRTVFPVQPEVILTSLTSTLKKFNSTLHLVTDGKNYNLIEYRYWCFCLCDPAGLSRGPSPISLSTQESWPVAAAITEYINAYFKGGEHNRSVFGVLGDLQCYFFIRFPLKSIFGSFTPSGGQNPLPHCPAILLIIFIIKTQLFACVCFSCLVKITGDLTMSFPAGITRIFNANPNAPVLSFRLVNISRVDHFLPNQKLLYRYDAQ